MNWRKDTNMCTWVLLPSPKQQMVLIVILIVACCTLQITLTRLKARINELEEGHQHVYLGFTELRQIND